MTRKASGRAASPSSRERGATDRAVATRWETLYGRAILQAGIAALPRALYLYQAALGLTAQEVWFISAILAHKWDADLPYPNLRTMAEQSGMSLRQLKRIRAGLEEKGTLQVLPRYEGTGRQEANSYDFARLFAQLESVIMADAPGDNGIQAEGGGPPAPPDPPGAMSFVTRFGRVIVRAGIAAIPQAIFTYQQPLRLTPQQIWFTGYILAHRWTTELPYPSLRRMAERTGYSERHLHTIKDELVAAGYLVLVERYQDGGGRDNNGYDFSGLLHTLNEQIAQERQATSKARGNETRPAAHEDRDGNVTDQGDIGFSGGGGHLDHRGGGLVVHTGEGQTTQRRGVPRSVGSRTSGAEGRGTPNSDESEPLQEEPYQKESIGSVSPHSSRKRGKNDQAQSYVAHLIRDITQELEHPLRRTEDERALEARSNTVHALRLWEGSGLAVEAFAGLAQEARRRTQAAKGKQGIRRLARPMAYFFRILERSLADDGGDESSPVAAPRSTAPRSAPQPSTAPAVLDPTKYLHGKYAHLFNRAEDVEE